MNYHNHRRERHAKNMKASLTTYMSGAQTKQLTSVRSKILNLVYFVSSQTDHKEKEEELWKSKHVKSKRANKITFCITQLKDSRVYK